MHVWVRRMLLAAHPHKQALAARELRQRGLLATPERPEPRDVTADDLPTLTYIDAVSPTACSSGPYSLDALVADPSCISTPSLGGAELHQRSAPCSDDGIPCATVLPDDVTG